MRAGTESAGTSGADLHSGRVSGGLSNICTLVLSSISSGERTTGCHLPFPFEEVFLRSWNLLSSDSLLRASSEYLLRASSFVFGLLAPPLPPAFLAARIVAELLAVP